MELSRVKSSRGSWESRVIQLLKWVFLGGPAVQLLQSDALSRSWKYYKPRENMSDHWVLTVTAYLFVMHILYTLFRGGDYYLETQKTSECL